MTSWLPGSCWTLYEMLIELLVILISQNCSAMQITKTIYSARVGHLDLVYVLEFTCWFCYFQGWLNHRSPIEAETLLGIFDRIFEDLFNYAIQSLNAKIEVLQSMQVMQVNRSFYCCERNL